MNIQIIKQGNEPEWAVVPYEAYLELVEKAEMLQDIQDDSAKAAYEHGWHAEVYTTFEAFERSLEKYT